MALASVDLLLAQVRVWAVPALGRNSNRYTAYTSIEDLFGSFFWIAPRRTTGTHSRAVLRSSIRIQESPIRQSADVELGRAKEEAKEQGDQTCNSLGLSCAPIRPTHTYSVGEVPLPPEPGRCISPRLIQVRAGE